MSCSHPLLAVDRGLRPDGKRNIKILTHIDDCQRVGDFIAKYQKFGHKLLMLPCGKCDGCKLAYRQSWSVRVAMEAKYHDQNCFITLTYDDDHYFVADKKNDYKKFIKALRNDGYKVRYFGCGEYGKNGRFHYHIILFGFFPDDIKFLSLTKSGFRQYSSIYLSRLWQRGFLTVSEFAPEAGGYVAGYCAKKMDSYFDEDVPSFIFMSRKPGIGYKYIAENFNSIYENDNVVLGFGKHTFAVPRYFDKIAEKFGYDLTDIKDYRADSSNVLLYSSLRDHGFKIHEELFEYNRSLMKDKLDRKVRSL